MVCIFEAVDCSHLRWQYMFNEFFSCICIGFSEFNKPAMCKISHSHFFSIMLFVLPFRTERSTYFILGKVCHFVGGLKHKIIYGFILQHHVDGDCKRSFCAYIYSLFVIDYLLLFVILEKSDGYFL